MLTVALTSQGRLTLPKSVRDEAGLRPGDRLTVMLTDDGTILLRPAGRPIEHLFGLLKQEGRQAATVQEMDDGIEEYVSQDNERIRSGG